MPVIRRYSPATDSALKCEGCFRQGPVLLLCGCGLREQFGSGRTCRAYPDPRNKSIGVDLCAEAMNPTLSGAL